MYDGISIRAYSRQLVKHSHPYFQFVFPINGFIDVNVGEFSGHVSVGEGILMMKNQEHGFTANEQARFIVIDVSSLPDTFTRMTSQKFVVSKSVMAFLHFLEIQLGEVTDTSIETNMIGLLVSLLENEPLVHATDSRLEAVFAFINEHTGDDLSVKRLAEIACLGETQFKKRFIKTAGVPPGAYVLEKRMNRAMALLRYTDMPVSLIAERAGYADVSAFSRRFHAFFGRPPRHYANKV